MKIKVLLLIAVASMFLGGCDLYGSNVKTGDNGTAVMEGNLTERNQSTLEKNQQPPTFEFSLERANLIKRLKTWNVPDKISYISLLSYGRVVAYYTVIGKVSSVNSLLTNSEQLVRVKSGSASAYFEYHNMPSPDLDGSYGENPSGGIFFYDAISSSYHEWRGDYLWTEEPQNLTSPPLIMVVKKG